MTIDRWYTERICEKRGLTKTRYYDHLTRFHHLGSCQLSVAQRVTVAAYYVQCEAADLCIIARQLIAADGQALLESVLPQLGDIFRQTGN